MNRWKKILVIGSGIIVFLFLLAWTLALIYEDQVKSMIVSSINSKLKTPVQVGDIQFSFIRQFPQATLEFTDIAAEGLAYKDVKQPLLSAHKLNLNFNLWEVFGSKVKVNHIEVKGGTAFLYIQKNGLANYDVWQSSGASGDNSGIDLNEVLIKDMLVVYKNELTAADYKMNIKKGIVAGSFTSSQYDLTAISEMKVEHFKMEEVNYLSNKEVELNLITHIDNSSGLYQVKKADLTVEKLLLHTEGSVQRLDEGSMVALKINADNAGLKELLTLIPKKYLTKIEDYTFSGKATFSANITGLAGKTGIPLVKADFSTVDATVQPKNSEHRLSRIRLKGTYTNQKSKLTPVSVLSFSHVTAMLDNQLVQGEFSMEDLADPWISMNVKGTLDLPTVASFYMPDTLSKLTGQLVIDMQFKGKAKNTASYQSSGKLELQNVAFGLKGKSAAYEDFNGLFTLDQNHLSVSNLKGRAAGSDFTINGNINNLFSFILQPDQVLTGSASLSSRNIDLSELLEDKGQSTANDTAYYLDINSNLNFLLHLNVGIISFRKFQAWNFNGDIAVRNKSIISNGLAFKSMSGGWNLTGSINAAHKDSILISCNANVKKIDINELFVEMGNFGQDIITSKNLRGKLTADITFAGMWSKTLNCNTNKMLVQSKFTIEQGELIKFEPMMALAKYIKGADLQDIKFSTLTNSIDIRGRKIYIPAMEIKSTAMELTASGTHTFDNIVDYKMQLLLSQLVGKKVKQMNTEFGKIEDDGLGRTKIFLTMKGPMEDPKIQFDKKAVEEKIVQDVKKEKENLKGILNKEFGWFKKDTTAVKQEQQKKKKEELQLDRDE